LLVLKEKKALLHPQHSISTPRVKINMKLSVTTLLALAASASAHTLMSEFYIDGTAQVSI